MEGTCHERHGFVLAVVGVLDRGPGMIREGMGSAVFNVLYQARWRGGSGGAVRGRGTGATGAWPVAPPRREQRPPPPAPPPRSASASCLRRAMSSMPRWPV